MATLPELLRQMVEMEGSDLHITTATSPQVRVHGELTRLEGQLNHILDQYAKLAELDTDAIPPTAQTIELENILREDVARPSMPPEDVLANAPQRDGDFFVVPAILGGD